VTVIDGATYDTAIVPTGSHQLPWPVNPITTRIYVANGGSNTVAVIDGTRTATVWLPWAGPQCWWP